MIGTMQANPALAAVLFPEYRRRVLALLLLQPNQRYHVREIARLTQTTPGTLTRELAKLADAGLVLRNENGRHVEYTANQASPVYSELASILRKTSGLADELTKALAPLADRLAVAFVYGSMASGKAGPASDIDLMLIGDGLTFADVVVALHPAQQSLGREINPKLFTRSEWRALVAEQGAFVRDIRAKPKVLVMGDLDELG